MSSETVRELATGHFDEAEHQRQSQHGITTMSSVLAALILMAATAADAQLKSRTINLERPGRQTLAKSTPQSIAAGENLNVICQPPLDCREVRASLTTALMLTSASAAPGQTNFVLPDTVGPTAGVELRVCASSIPDADCLRTARVVAIAIDAAAARVAANHSDVRRFCAQVGTAQVAEITSRRGNTDFTVVLFDETGPCYLSRQFGAEGDPIAVGFVSAEAQRVSLDLDPCNTLDAAPKILKSADVSTLNLQADEARGTMLSAQWFAPLRRCFGTAAGVKVTVGTGQDATAVSYSLKQFERYRATLQIGVAASALHARTFGLRTAGSVKRIIETSAPERGPEYVGSVVLYGLPHYFVRPSRQASRFIEQPATAGSAAVVAPGAAPDQPVREPYFGRDPVNENSVADRIGLLLGAGISQPGRRFLAGAAFEVLTGVNVFLSREFHRTPELEGTAPGAEFVGDATAIPLRDHWRQAWTAGLSLDARYALALFGRK